jgi:hypothetical protein
MGFFAQGSPEEYLQHNVAVCLINQKGREATCKRLIKEK